MIKKAKDSQDLVDCAKTLADGSDTSLLAGDRAKLDAAAGQIKAEPRLGDVVQEASDTPYEEEAFKIIARDDPTPCGDPA